jgi:hypothetical protein
MYLAAIDNWYGSLHFHIDDTRKRSAAVVLIIVDRG